MVGNLISTKAFWFQAKNFGDCLTPVILKALLNESVELCRDGNGRWILAGSIIHTAHDNDIIFGTGSFKNHGTNAQNLTVLAVRGPLTAEKLNIKTAYGDAGLIMPMIYPKSKSTKKFGVVPHYVDFDDAHKRVPELCIDVRNSNPLPVIDAITSCSVILSSSLHGIVIAEAYGIPAFRTTFANSYSKICSFDYKHEDYYLGTGRKLPPPLSLDDFLAERFPDTDLDSVQRAVDNIYDIITSYIDREKIRESA